MAEVALWAAADWARGVADSIVPELSSWAGDSGSDADSIGEVKSSVAGITESVGEAGEAVG